MASIPSFLIADLLQGYRSGSFSVRDVIECALERADQAAQRNIWITRLSLAEALGYARALDPRLIDEQPLYGIPFVIKDNIDLAGVATTAACREYAYVPAQSAAVVQRLLDAGAIPLGKTNLDQFATGLVGTRSPYGACRNSFDARYISGGSSSGSAVAVATGLASFALGTDTAGSGRIPAGFNNLVGLKPSLGRLSTRGVVPACRSLDCVSILSMTCEDAARVLAVAEAFDPQDEYSRPVEQVALGGFGVAGGGFRVGVPCAGQLEFFGDLEYARLFDAAAARIAPLGGSLIEVDAAPLLEAARLLYEGPWIAERFAALAPFMQTHADAMYPVTRDIIRGGATATAVDAFQAQYRLMALKRIAEKVWSSVDAMLMPTAPTIFEIAQVEADPVRLNSALGYYTNFVNLMDLAAVAVPAGFRSDGLPFGVTFIAPRSTDRALLMLAGRLHRCFAERLGATQWSMPPLATRPDSPALEPGFMAIAVCGAHMQGLPLNRQLLERGGYLLKRTRTAPRYRLYALKGPPPQRPGLVQASLGGASIELELWAVRSSDVGSFLAGIPAPLGLGKIELENGEVATGFLCESHATADAADITALGGWRAFVKGSVIPD